ncbi:MAG: SufE family protein [Planctomycetota bacterium]
MAAPNLIPPPIDEIRDNFAFFDSWEDRFTYLIDLGKKLPPFPEPLKDEPHRVHGCQSNVWLDLQSESVADEDRLHLLAVSDAHIVNGLIAVLRSLYHGQPLNQVQQLDAEELFRALGLDEHLSPTRRNGLHAMIQRIRQLAQAQAESPQA